MTGACYKCVINIEHPWHDNGTVNVKDMWHWENGDHAHCEQYEANAREGVK